MLNKTGANAHALLNKIKANACVLGPSLNLSQHIHVEQDRGKCACSESFSGAVDTYDLKPSVNLSQHINVEQDRGKRVCY